MLLFAYMKVSFYFNSSFGKYKSIGTQTANKLKKQVFFILQY